MTMCDAQRFSPPTRRGATRRDVPYPPWIPFTLPLAARRAPFRRPSLLSSTHNLTAIKDEPLDRHLAWRRALCSPPMRKGILASSSAFAVARIDKANAVDALLGGHEAYTECLRSLRRAFPFWLLPAWRVRFCPTSMTARMLKTLIKL